LNLLAIDDNIDTTEAVADYCDMQGIDCKVANDGHQGLLEIQTREYDLIILDIAMPECTGFDILSQLKKQGVRNETIVVLTGWNVKKEDFKDYKDVGVKEILKKPIGVDSLDNIVKTCLTDIRRVNPVNILSVH
jgi:DNA-binding response OmpR family regulator